MNNNKYTNVFKNSIILSLLVSFFLYIKKLIHNSYFVSLFTSYNRIESACYRSRSSDIITSLSSLKFKSLGFKNACAKYAENSIIMNTVKLASGRFFNTNLRSIGIFLLSAGGLIVSAIIAQHTEAIWSFKFSDTFILGFVMTAFSLVLLPLKNKSISSCIKESRFLSYFFVDIFYVKGIDSNKSDIPNPTTAFSFILGILFGIISIAVSPVPLLFIMGITAYLYLVFSMPENGVLLICLQLPLLSDKLLGFLVFSTATALIFKAVRGKRTLKFNICTGALIIIALVIISSALVTFDSSGAFNELLPLISAIILSITVIMTVRSSSLAEKCYSMLGMSAIITVLFGINNAIATYIHSSKSISVVIDEINTGITSTFGSNEIYAAFLIAMIPLFLVKQASKSKIFSLFFLAVVVISLLMCNSYYAILALFVALVISISILSKLGLLTAIIAVAASSFIGFIIKFIFPYTSSNFYGKNEIFANNSFFSISQLLDFFTKHGVAGVGMGEESLAYAALDKGINAAHIENGFGIYTDFAMKIGLPLLILCAVMICVFISRMIWYVLAKYKSEAAKSKVAALFTSFIALAIYAFYSDFLYDFRILALTFLILGLSSAVSESADNDYISPDGIGENEFLYKE